jgi:hypothetical protein
VRVVAILVLILSLAMLAFAWWRADQVPPLLIQAQAKACPPPMTNPYDRVACIPKRKDWIS